MHTLLVSARCAAMFGLVLVVACSSGASTTALPGASPTTAPVTLSIWAMGNEGDRLGTSDVVAQFQKDNPGTKINVTAVPWAVAHDKLIASVAGKNTPDLTQLGSTWAGEFSKLNAFDAVPDTIAADQFYPAAAAAATVNGKLVGVPWYIDTRVLYYRTDLAQQAGITQAPKTWDDLNKLADAYHAAGAKYGIALSSNSWEEYVPFLYSAGGDIMQDGKFTLDSPAAVRALSEYVSFFSRRLTPPTQPPGFDVTQTFVAGDTPMFFSGPWQRGLIDRAAPQLEGKWATARIPMDKTSTSFVGGGEWAVFKNSPHREASWKFVQYLLQPAVQVAWFKTSNDLPAVRAAWTDPLIAADATLSVFADQLNDAKTPPAITQWEEIARQMDDWLEKACLDLVTPSAGAEGMQQAVNSIYKP